MLFQDNQRFIIKHSSVFPSDPLSGSTFDHIPQHFPFAYRLLSPLIASSLLSQHKRRGRRGKISLCVWCEQFLKCMFKDSRWAAGDTTLKKGNEHRNTARRTQPSASIFVFAVGFLANKFRVKCDNSYRTFMPSASNNGRISRPTRQFPDENCSFDSRSDFSRLSYKFSTSFFQFL